MSCSRIQSIRSARGSRCIPKAATAGYVAPKMTMTEGIIARRAGQDSVAPGDNVWVDVDKLMTHDVCGPGTFGIFEKEFGEDAQVWDRERVVLMPDHYIFTEDPRANRNVDVLREYAQKYDIKYFYDITDRSDFKANPDYRGVCHIALAEEAHTMPGFVLGTGKLLVKVPPTLLFKLEGEMPPYITAKDIILHIIGEIGVAGATYKAIEFAGSTLASMNMEERMTLCNMAIEAGGKNGIIAPDATTFEYLAARKPDYEYTPVYADPEANYEAVYTIDVASLDPIVAAPHSPDNRKNAKDCSTVPIDRSYIGSCTGGKTSDFHAAAHLLHHAGEQVAVPTFLVPATQQVWADVYSKPVPGCDGKTAAEIFQEAGCVTPAAPSCAACLGGPVDTFARVNEAMTVVSTTNRNFPGRMGHKDAQVYLASPYTAAASALAGRVCDPREFM